VLEMLRVEPWLRFPLTLNFTSSAHSALRLGAPPPPPHVAVLTAPLEVGLPLESQSCDGGDAPCM